MAKVVVYVTDYCGYCLKAKNLLRKKNIEFEEIDMTNNDELRSYVMKASGRWTVPQIFINDKPIGGASELYELNSTGEFDKLLQ